jgi:hypothetical protein
MATPNKNYQQSPVIVDYPLKIYSNDSKDYVIIEDERCKDSIKWINSIKDIDPRLKNCNLETTYDVYQWIIHNTPSVCPEKN